MSQGKDLSRKTQRCNESKFIGGRKKSPDLQVNKKDKKFS